MFLAICFLLGAVVMAFGVASMKTRGASGDDVMAAMTMAISFGVISVLMMALAMKVRQTYFVDKFGDRVAEDGSSLAFVVTGQHLGSQDLDNDEDSSDYGGDDFD